MPCLQKEDKDLPNKGKIAPKHPSLTSAAGFLHAFSFSVTFSYKSQSLISMSYLSQDKFFNFLVFLDFVMDQR
jgi:hypothetical protein